MEHNLRMTEYRCAPVFGSVLLTMPYSSLDNKRLKSLYELSLATIAIKGDIAECGVFLGGSAFMIGMTAHFKTIHLFDSFGGLPEASNEDGDIYQPEGAFCCDLITVKQNLTDLNNIIFHPGWLKDTLGECENINFSLVHLDLDRYYSYKISLDFFWDRLSVGGFLICDDYDVGDCQGATKAINEFISKKKIMDIQFTSCQLIIQKKRE